MKIHDISTQIKSGMVVYPGNPAVEIRQVGQIPAASSNLSLLVMGSHTGTHIDARRHVENGALGVDQIALEKCYGPCKVLDLQGIEWGKGIGERDLRSASLKIRKGDIVLLKTKNSSLGYKAFREDFIYLTEEGAHYLVRRGVKAVGIDFLSIQKFRTGYCAAHCALLKQDIPIFEGLDLSGVEQGAYTFAGFPLKIKECDGAPVRAVLIEK